VQGLIVGPFIVGSVSEQGPRTLSDVRQGRIAWLLTCLLILSASVPVGLLLLIPTVIYLFAVTPRTTNPEVQP